MARGRPEGSKSTTAVKLADLVQYLPAGAVVMVGTTWLRMFEQVNNVRFAAPDAPQAVSPVDTPEVLDGGEEKDAEPRERIQIVRETL